MTGSRITSARAAWIRERLGQRDLEIIQTLGRVRVASVRQLERLHFVAGTPLSNARSCRATLSRLTRWKALTRLERRVGGVRAGSSGFVYALGVAAQRIAGHGGPAGGHQYRRPWTPSKPFLDHALDVAELYVRLVEAERAGSLELVEFEAEPACWRPFTGVSGEVVRLKPDAFIRAGVGDFEEHAFVEVDRGTESTRALGLKCDRYRLYWMAGREQQARGVHPRALWLVPNRRRYRQLVDVVGRQPAEAWKLFQVALFEDVLSALGGGSDG